MDVLEFHFKKFYNKLTHVKITLHYQVPSRCLETRIGGWRGNMLWDEARRYE